MEAFNMKNPCLATVRGLHILTKEGSAKETIHIDFCIAGSGLQYVTGDALSVIPCNEQSLVDSLISALKLNASEKVSLADGSTCSLRQALIEQFNITKLQKGMLTKWNNIAQSQSLSTLLADKEALKSYLYGHDLLDIASNPDMTAIFADAQSFVSILGKITPRLYSIASSPNAVEGQVTLCVGAVRYSMDGRARNGVCSTYMSDRLKAGDKARVFVHSNKNFRLPENGNTPVIMVGPGTGIAPFRAFWQQRIFDKAQGGLWFFFGNPYAATDSCYENEIEELVKAGKMKYSVAWSRDQAHKIYVQHLLEQNSEEIWQWLEQGAAFYICGDANRMAKDVEDTLLAIIGKYGACSEEDAKSYLAAMKATKRYQKDVY